MNITPLHRRPRVLLTLALLTVTASAFAQPSSSRPGETTADKAVRLQEFEVTAPRP